MNRNPSPAGHAEQHLIDLAILRLAAKHTDKSFAEVIDAVTRARVHFDGKPIRDFVPLLVERHADKELGIPLRPSDRTTIRR
ncbi:three-helix bundle dimerization domain-containing protein [Rhodococcus sp. NPDC003318]|uniref:three-helix bundle dimerization domain-containing protein n=1 Tax=Rhodococcus sp. NPDC003318 TaxID=3364503 RepID=UPI0036CC0EE7